MRILKSGEPCPCCGMPIRCDLPRWKLLLLSYIAEGVSLMDAVNALAEVMELPPLGSTETAPPSAQGAVANGKASGPKATPSTSETEGEEKRAILQQLTNYRAVNGPGCLDAVARATSTKGRINSNTLRMLLVGDTKMPIDDWRKVGRALDKLERPADKAGVLAAPPKRRQGPGRGADGGADADG